MVANGPILVTGAAGQSGAVARRWNGLLWSGFLLVLAAPVSYLTLLVRFPATRDVPWAPLPIYGAGLASIAIGVRRAFREPGVYRGRIAGPTLLGLGVV